MSEHAIQCLDWPTTLYGDCLNVVQSGAIPQNIAHSAKYAYAPFTRTAASYHSYRHLIADVKVKAHVDVTTLTDPLLIRHAIGNAAADSAANDAHTKHPKQASYPTLGTPTTTKTQTNSTRKPEA